MENERFITLQKISSHYNVEMSFIKSLNEYGWVEIAKVGEQECVDREYLGDIEKFIHFHYDLEINLEGIEAIHHLLERVKEMQKELVMLRNRLDYRQ
jgi:hypothetical protein